MLPLIAAQTASSLFSNSSGSVGGTAGGLAGSLGSSLGGGTDSSKSSAEAGDFYGGDFTITKEDSTIKYAMIIGGIILLFAIFKRFK